MTVPAVLDAAGRRRSPATMPGYLGLGLAAAGVIHVLDLEWIKPFEDARLIEHLTEFALVVALFASGLTINRALRWRQWRAVVGLLGLVMPLTIAAGALFGAAAMALSAGRERRRSGYQQWLTKPILSTMVDGWPGPPRSHPPRTPPRRLPPSLRFADSPTVWNGPPSRGR